LSSKQHVGTSLDLALAFCFWHGRHSLVLFVRIFWKNGYLPKYRWQLFNLLPEIVFIVYCYVKCYFLCWFTVQVSHRSVLSTLKIDRQIRESEQPVMSTEEEGLGIHSFIWMLQWWFYLYYNTWVIFRLL